jgi:general stress protein YciG
MTAETKSFRRGFAAMSAEQRREIASKGGRNVPGEHRAFAKRRDLASRAGRKGGLESGRRRHRLSCALFWC